MGVVVMPAPKLLRSGQLRVRAGRPRVPCSPARRGARVRQQSQLIYSSFLLPEMHSFLARQDSSLQHFLNHPFIIFMRKK
jgi:hypothetical protein